MKNERENSAVNKVESVADSQSEKAYVYNDAAENRAKREKDNGQNNPDRAVFAHIKPGHRVDGKQQLKGSQQDACGQGKSKKQQNILMFHNRKTPFVDS